MGAEIVFAVIVLFFCWCFGGCFGFWLVGWALFTFGLWCGSTYLCVAFGMLTAARKVISVGAFCEPVWLL